VRVAEIESWVVNAPLRGAFQSSFETKSGTTRTIVRVRTDDGAEGWGETMHGRPTKAIIDRIQDRFDDLDPRDTAEVRRRCHMVPFFHGYLGYCAIAGVEMALFDLACRLSDVPLCSRLGGAVRDRVPITCLLTRADARTTAPSQLAGALAERAAELVGSGHFQSLKLKGSADARRDVAIVEALRRALPETGLRLDPNAVWSVPDAIWAARALEHLGLEYLEDPCEGLEAMARVRAAARIPLCTNMCVVRLEDLAPAIRMGAVDVVHADVHKWGGVHATLELQAVCRAFGLGLNFHSGGELGISTACHLHLAAAMDRLDYAIDSMYYLATEDVIVDRVELRDGALTVPRGPGLGVQVDVGRVRELARRNEIEGDHTL
jgi:glucarate dehydratase